MEFSREALGLVVREYRETLRPRLTQEQLGAAAGYGAGASVSISRIESGLSRPGPDRFAGIARALGLTPGQLEAEAAQRTAALSMSRVEDPSGTGKVRSDESIGDRAKRIQQEIDRRASAVTELGNAFNEAHDRAQDNFFMRFVQIAGGVTGAPQPEPTDLPDSGDEGPESQADYRRRVTSYDMARLLAGGVGGGTAVRGLGSGLGIGTLAAGGTRIASGATLTGLVAAPALILAVGGLIWIVKRSRKQQQELAEKLTAVDADLEATRTGFEALTDILPRATGTLSYIALHGGHALERWERQLGSRPLRWDAMNADDKRQYQNFIEISASHLSVAGIDVQNLLVSRGADRERLVELADEILTQAQRTVESIV